MRRRRNKVAISRYILLGSLMVVIMAGLAGRAAYLQLWVDQELQQKGNAYHLRDRIMPARRGMILDRNGEPLAVSTPMLTVSADPQVLLQKVNRAYWRPMASQLGLRPSNFRNRIHRFRNKSFMILRRNMQPADLGKISPGVRQLITVNKNYRRYYPTAATTAQVVGFTDLRDRGQEGIEASYNRQLAGHNGSKRVIIDTQRRAVEDVEQLAAVRHGQNLVLSLDARIQSTAYLALRAAVTKFRAASGSVVVMDIHTGEILAMVNMPDFNPNVVSQRRGDRYRNRSVTDLFEPGSTIKPLVVETALEAHLVTPDTRIDTSPGTLRIGNRTIHDVSDHGLLTVSQVLIKSSNVGAAKIAMKMPAKQLRRAYDRAGLGHVTASGLPGEVRGILPNRRHWKPIEHATLAFGYGLMVTPLQLARLYAGIANAGEMPTPTIFKRTTAAPVKKMMESVLARRLALILEKVTETGGTAIAAATPLYRVAGKTGTTQLLVNGSYKSGRYDSIFAGFGPVSRPRLATVVVVRDPRRGGYFGGTVAAPVFSRVMAESLRLLNAAPDKVENIKPASLVQQQTVPIIQHVIQRQDAS